jgi:uncharacterized protein YdhG (YjbR/CyaY superfamily)
MSARKRPHTIDEYIAAAPEVARKNLIEMCACLRESAPGAAEAIKWGVPAFAYRRILFTFAARKDHIGFYPTPSAVEAFSKELADFKTGKGSIQFPLEKTLPLALIRKIAVFRVREVNEKDAKWM